MSMFIFFQVILCVFLCVHVDFNYVNYFSTYFIYLSVNMLYTLLKVNKSCKLIVLFCLNKEIIIMFKLYS